MLWRYLYFSVLPEHGHADIPTFYTCDEGLSALTQEGQATLERLEGMLAQSVAQQYRMAGVRTEETNADFEGLNQTHTHSSLVIREIALRLQAQRFDVELRFYSFIFHTADDSRPAFLYTSKESNLLSL